MGGLQIKQATPVFYYWSPAKAVYRLLPALLLLPFLLLKPNRQPKAWVALIPFFAIIALASAGRQIPQVSLANAFSYGFPYIAMLASSLCMLCMIIHALPALSRRGKLLMLLSVFILPGMILLFFSQAEGKLENWYIPAGYAVAPLIMLTSFFLAGRRCRERWGMRRFSLWVVAWSFLFLLAVTVVFFGILILTQNVTVPVWWMLLAPFAALLVAAAATLFAVAFAFILTAFLNPLYRERLMAVFGVVPGPPPVQPATPVNPAATGQAS